MVRFIMHICVRACFRACVYLHSNMVRFIMFKIGNGKSYFEFIYIPIWLDLLFLFGAYNNSAAYIFTFQYG